jgi:hypothetical protein
MTGRSMFLEGPAPNLQKLWVQSRAHNLRNDKVMAGTIHSQTRKLGCKGFSIAINRQKSNQSSTPRTVLSQANKITDYAKCKKDKKTKMPNKQYMNESTIIKQAPHLVCK